MTLSTANAGQASAAVVRPCWLIDMAFPGGTVFVTDADHPITANSATYLPTPTLLDPPQPSDARDGKSRRLTVTLSAFDATLKASVFAGGFAFGTFTARMALLGSNGQPVDTPVVLTRGYLSQGRVSIDEAAGSIEISAETQSIRLRRKALQLVTSAGQQLRYAGDTGMDDAPNIAARKITWGGQSDTPATSARAAGSGGASSGVSPLARELVR